MDEIESLDNDHRSQGYLVSYFDQNRDALHAAKGRWTDPIVGMTFVLVEPGRFRMGSPPEEVGRDADEPRHSVELTRPFWIAATEVTRRHFAVFVDETGYETEAERAGGSLVRTRSGWQKKLGVSWRDSGAADHPVVHVSWNDAWRFCEWLETKLGMPIRLPTEAQWEYAARAGSTEATYAGDVEGRPCETPVLQDAAWYCGNSGGAARPVGLKEPNAWRLHDMLGNVWEWVEDAAHWDPGAADVSTATYVNDALDPLSEEGEYRVVRGGSWESSAYLCRAASRFVFPPAAGNDTMGFRIVSPR